MKIATKRAIIVLPGVLFVAVAAWGAPKLYAGVQPFSTAASAEDACSFAVHSLTCAASDHFCSHSDSFGFGMEIDTAGCRACGRDFIVGGDSNMGVEWCIAILGRLLVSVSQ